MLNNRTTTRVLAVVITFMVVWTIVAVGFRWTPGVLDGIKFLVAEHQGKFIVMAVITGILHLYWTWRGAVYFWNMSSIIYEKPEEL